MFLAFHEILGLALILIGGGLLLAWLKVGAHKRPDAYEDSLADIDHWRPNQSLPKPPRPRPTA